jgi:hypothetical protein
VNARQPGSGFVPAPSPCCNWSNGFGRAVSRILSSPNFFRERIICLSSQYPEPVSRCETWNGPLRGSLFGLAPDGVFRASALALGAVRSYRTFSPLPASLAKRRRYFLCGTIRRDASRRRLPRVSQPERAWVTRHRALRCSDFPPPPKHFGRSDSPPFQNHGKSSRKAGV